MTNRKTALLSLLAAAATAATLLLSTPAQAGGSISIPLPPLPPIPQIKLPAPPLMVWLPVPMVYVAMDSPYPIFCHENHYYLHSNNVWYIGPGFAGPWMVTQINLLPPGLHHFHGHEWERYQHDARYWRNHNQQGHPHFYGSHHGESRAAQAPRQYRDEHRPQQEYRGRHNENRHAYIQPPAHKLEHNRSRSESPGRGYNTGYTHPNHRDIVRAQYRAENRGRDHGHRRMSY